MEANNSRIKKSHKLYYVGSVSKPVAKKIGYLMFGKNFISVEEDHEDRTFLLKVRPGTPQEQINWLVDEDNFPTWKVRMVMEKDCVGVNTKNIKK